MSSPKMKRKKTDVDEESDDSVAEEGELSATDEDSDDVDDESEDADSLDSDDKRLIDKEMIINFGAYQPKDDDFNGIRSLLSQLWLKESVDVSELTKLLIDERSICSVIKQDLNDEEESDEEEDDEVYAITSIVVLADTGGRHCVQQIKDTLLSYIAKDDQMREMMTDNWNHMGLIVNERFANIPSKLSLPSYQQLMTDLKAKQETTDEKEGSKFQFKWYLMICKVLKTRPSKTKNSTNSEVCDEVVYLNVEDEIFDELAEHRFEYSVAKQRDADVLSGDWKDDKLYEPFRRVLIISTGNWLKAIDKLKEEFKK